MTTPADQTASPILRRLTGGTRHLLLDFDGPICAVFAGIPSSDVADQLREALTTAGFALPPHSLGEVDPLELFRAVAQTGPEAAATAQQLLTAFETQAVATAWPTSGAADLIITAHRTGRTVTIVSNNSSAAIAAYLADHHLAKYIHAVFGRNDTNPALMKPSPYRVREAVDSLEAEPRDCMFIGDSSTDVVAGRKAGVSVIGFANKSGKADVLSEARADAVTTNLAEITAAFNGTPCPPPARCRIK